MKKWFGDLRLGAKVLWTFGGVLAMTAVLACVTFSGFARLRTTIRNMDTFFTPSIVYATQIDGVAKDELLFTWDHIQTPEVAKKQSIDRMVHERRDSLAVWVKSYEPLLDDSTESARFHEFESGWKDFCRIQDSSLALSRDGKTSSAVDVVQGPLRDAFVRMSAGIEATVKVNIEQTRTGATDSETLFRQILFAVSLVVGFQVLVVLGFQWLLKSSIAKPVEAISKVVQGIGEGDLSLNTSFSTRDEVGLLSGAVSRMTTRLVGSLSGIGTDARELSAAADRTSRGAGDMEGLAKEGLARAETLSASATQMSASLGSVAAAGDQSSRSIGQIAAAIEQMVSSVGEIARSAETSRVSAKDAVLRVADSSRSVQELSDASREITKVVEAIVEIAEQTKLLALNATIEAARAGEMGKGFAVVASEVKELAKGTADASEDIRRRIEAMQTSTVATVAQIQAIDSAIRQVDGLAGSIAAAVEEQSATTREIATNANQAARGIAEVTQMVGQIAQSSGEVSREAETLRQNSLASQNVAKESRGTAQELAKMSGSLRDQVALWRLP